jgi:hypothetical protein
MLQAAALADETIAVVTRETALIVWGVAARWIRKATS